MLVNTGTYVGGQAFLQDAFSCVIMKNSIWSLNYNNGI